MSDARFATSIGEVIARCLEARKRRTYEQIQNYPTPITGCDQQFNSLLEEQARVIEELEELQRRMAAAPAQSDLTELFDGFIRSSSGLDDDAKRGLSSRLKWRA